NPHAGRVDNVTADRSVRRIRSRPLRRLHDRLDRELIDRRTATGRRIERGMDVSVLAVGGLPERIRFGEVAEHRMAAALRDVTRFLVVADQRRDVVTGANERVEHGGTDVAGGTGEKDPHRGVYHSAVTKLRFVTRSAAASAARLSRASTPTRVPRWGPRWLHGGFDKFLCTIRPGKHG